MSNVKIEGNASGTGTFTIAAPNSNTDRTFNLPDEAGTVLTSASDVAASALTGDIAAARITDALNAGGSAPIYACRAWVNFNGTGTVAIRESGNVSSITDNGTGDYTVNFTTAMPDANYAATALAGLSTNTGNPNYTVGLRSPGLSTSSFRFRTLYSDSNNALDLDLVCVSVFR
jgi:hypothetical protein